MADEKKPKIDLKARLGKTNVGVAPPSGVPAAGPGAIPAPPSGPGGLPGMGGPTSNRPPPQSIPVPQGLTPSGMPAGLDPSNPIVAAMARQGPRAPAPPPQPQRIEIDETVVEEVRGKSRKQGILMGLIAGVVFAIIGYFGGVANEARGAREKSIGFAKSLSTDVTTAKGQLEKIVAKLDEGKESLSKKKFPDSLARDLRALNVDFDGLKLQGARFSGFSSDTTQSLMQFITMVQSVNDRRQAVANLLDSVQKPLNEMWNGKPQTLFVAIMTRTQRGPFAQLAMLKEPMTGDPPAEFIVKPSNKVSKFGGELKDAPAAVPLMPGSFEQACPPESAGQVSQLGAQLAKLINEIRGEKETADNPVDTKPGLLKKAEQLNEGLLRVK